MRPTWLRWGTWWAWASLFAGAPSLAHADAGLLMRQALPSVAVPAACLMLFMATIQRRR